MFYHYLEAQNFGPQVSFLFTGTAFVFLSTFIHDSFFGELHERHSGMMKTSLGSPRNFMWPPQKADLAQPLILQSLGLGHFLPDFIVQNFFHDLKLFGIHFRVPFIFLTFFAFLNDNGILFLD